MKKANSFRFNQALILSCCLLILAMLAQPSLLAQNIIDEWQNVKAPPAPELKPVTVDPKATALLMLDFNKQTCNAEHRPHCIASIPKVHKLLAEARARGVFVVYSLSAGATPADIAKELTPQGGEPIVTAGPDKFLGTDLEKILKEKNVKTVIVVGTAVYGLELSQCPTRFNSGDSQQNGYDPILNRKIGSSLRRLIVTIKTGKRYCAEGVRRDIL